MTGNFFFFTPYKMQGSGLSIVGKKLRKYITCSQKILQFSKY